MSIQPPFQYEQVTTDNQNVVAQLYIFESTGVENTLTRQKEDNHEKNIMVGSAALSHDALLV